MDLETIVSRLNAIEDQIKALNNSLVASNGRLNEVDERTNSFLGMVRDEKQEIARLNSTVMSLGKFDGTINQMRADFNRRIEEIQNQRKQEDQVRANLFSEDIKNVITQMEKMKNDIRLENEKRLSAFIEENTRLINRFKEIEEKNKQKIVSAEELRTTIGSMQQDLRRTVKQVETMTANQELFRNTQNEIRSKLETIADSLRNNETRLNELVATESERRKNQLDFMQNQSVLNGDRERKWNDWSQQFENAISQVKEILPDLQKQQFTMKQAQNDLSEVTQQFERRIKEITEMYRLTDEKFKKEWDTFKADTEKRWSNISLVLDDKQGSYSDRLKQLQERMVNLEDNNHEMQEVLLLMSTEIQKGMQNIMKMVNGWMDAFSHIKTTK